MFFDEEIVEEYLDKLKHLVETNKLSKDKCNNFIEYHEFEEEFSLNDIKDIQNLFIEEVKKYLSSKFPGQYAIWRDSAVHITTVELYREIMWKGSKHTESYIKLKESKEIIY